MGARHIDLFVCERERERAPLTPVPLLNGLSPFLPLLSPPSLVAKFQDFQTFPGRGNGLKGEGASERELLPTHPAAAASSYVRTHKKKWGSLTRAGFSVRQTFKVV